MNCKAISSDMSISLNLALVARPLSHVFNSIKSCSTISAFPIGLFITIALPIGLVEMVVRLAIAIITSPLFLLRHYGACGEKLAEMPLKAIVSAEINFKIAFGAFIAPFIFLCDDTIDILSAKAFEENSSILNYYHKFLA